MNNEELNKNVLKRVKRKIAISHFEKEDTKMVKNKIGKMVATFLLTTGLTASVVFAGTIVYEKVFKEPKKYESYEGLIQDIKESQGSQEITKEDEEKAVKIEFTTNKDIIINIVVSVKDSIVMKETSAKLQENIKMIIKKATDLDVKEINIKIKGIEQEKKTQTA